MRILITPHDIIERALWDSYEYYVLEKGTNIEELIEKNEEFEISETDALVIGLLKCIETDNLVHRFNQYLQEILSIKSSQIDKGSSRYYIRKKIIEESIQKFEKKFPECWEPRLHYKAALEEVLEYLGELSEKLETLSIKETTDQYGTHEYVQSNHVKKMLNFHN